MIKGLIENKILSTSHILASNRTPGKLQKMIDSFGIVGKHTNEEVVESSDIVVLATKPQDLTAVLDSLVSSFNEGQIVISLAAGITLRTLEKKLPQCRIIRLMPNTPTLISKGILGYVTSKKEETLSTVVEDLFSTLGSVIGVDDEDQFEALTIACASGPGFIFELMLYWQDWILERGFEPEIARKMTVETFLGASMLASLPSEASLDELQNKVTSKKGVTSAGLESMRELEIERALRISFEKAALRNQELAKGT